MDESTEELEKRKQDAIYDALKQIVKIMLEKNYTLEQIMEISKLSEKEINDIKQHIENADSASEKE